MKNENVTALTEAAISHIREKLRIHLWNLHQEDIDPFENAEKFKNDVFEVEAYSWDEDYNQTYNFKWKDYEISWYKHFGRGMAANRKINPDEVAVMLEECLASIKTKESDIDNIEKMYEEDLDY